MSAGSTVGALGRTKATVQKLIFFCRQFVLVLWMIPILPQQNFNLRKPIEDRIESAALAHNFRLRGLLTHCA